jgi:hypothetical protein
MVKVVAAVMLVVLVMLQTAWAESVSPLEDAMRKDPDRFRVMAEDVIAGFGGPAGLTPAGIEEHVALERATARAGAMRRLLAMDLDNDGSVTRDELGVTLRAASATARGRLERQFTAADMDADNKINAAEMRSEGQAAALRALTDAEAAILRSLMTLDANQDGALAQEELRQALQRLDEVT